ncbi:peptidylprolyl isomerase A [Candidatus Woesearchaeota archaeon]|nr:peptidylprolyl isomerase A [Candidatus Woesearchaeota archaeon]
MPEDTQSQETPETPTTPAIEGDTVVLETTKGNIEIKLNPGKAPVTVKNFLTYVNEGHYDDTVFHRVIVGFMIQGGGFTEDAVQKPTHDPIILESENGLANKRGTIAMARTMVPDSATSQFFINVADNAMLDFAPRNPGYAVFGEVTVGMNVVDDIVQAKTVPKGQHQDWPRDSITITKAYVKG